MGDTAVSSMLRKLGKLGGQFLAQVGISVAATLCATLSVSGLIHPDIPKIERASNAGEVTKAEPSATGQIASASIAADAPVAKLRSVEDRAQREQVQSESRVVSASADQEATTLEVLPVSLAPIPPIRSRVLHEPKAAGGRVAETSSACGHSCAGRAIVAAANITASAARKAPEPLAAQPQPLPAEEPVVEARVLDMQMPRAMLAMPMPSIRSTRPLLAGMNFVTDMVAGLGRGL